MSLHDVPVTIGTPQPQTPPRPSALTDDKPKDECGVLGLSTPHGEGVAQLAFFGLFALQHDGEAITLQRKNMVEREGGNGDNYVNIIKRGRLPGFGLVNIEDHIPMTQHCPFGQAGRAACVLQKCNVRETQFDRLQGLTFTRSERRFKCRAAR